MGDITHRLSKIYYSPAEDVTHKGSNAKIRR